ncbi:MAG: protein kinase [Planctomycetaceae bacterium]|nr:protein kinase [Planctomycetaceae bacterium]MCA9029476.1 protein kinase [Planctomycetaceae bacterium]MCA9043211.1 protein kinase [Planctomycetaceae bacterium]MCB9950658.1 protein kinase [Planctomycetaceae bacterium]
MQVRCPSCQTSIELSQDTVSGDVTCPSCDSQFNFLGDVTVKSEFEGGSLGRFEIQDKLGAGAFGTVWKAYDTELDRTVALKIPHEQHPSKDAAESFLREARAAAQLKHPSIVAIHEIGRVNDKTFIVCDLVNGLTLGDRLSAGPMPVVESVKLTAEIAEALHAAHEAGIVHRDLKPSNVMLDEHNRPHVMDFGLAKREQGEVTVTEDGKILGTPAYMSPEQAKGASHAADRRADIYALGVMLFEMLTGEKPFRGSVRMLLHQVINDDPPSPRTLNSNVPLDLETICLKCMEKDPDRRYHTAAALAADLNRFLNGEPVVARPVGSIERLWRWCQRKPAIAGALGTICFLLVAFSILAGYAYFTERHLRTTAENATNEAKTAQEAAVKAVASLRIAQTELMASMKATERALAASKESEAKAVDAQKVAEVAEQKATAETRKAEEQRQLLQGQFDSAIAALRATVEDVEGKLHALSQTHAVRENLLNITLEHVQEIRRSGGSQPELDYVEGLAYHRLGYLKNQLADVPAADIQDRYRHEAYEFYSKAVPLLMSASNRFPDDVDIRMQDYWNCLRLASLEAQFGNRDQVNTLVSAYVESADQLGRDFPANRFAKNATFFSRSQAGQALRIVGEFQNSLDTLQEALETSADPETVSDREEKWVAEQNLHLLHFELGKTYAAMEDWDAAIESLRKSLQLAVGRQQRYPENQYLRSVALTGHYELATTCYKGKRFADAYAAFQAHRDFYFRYWPDGALWTDNLTYYAVSAFKAGDFEFGEETLLEVANTVKGRFEASKSVPAGEEYHGVLSHLVDLYTAWDKPEQAAEWQAKADALAAQVMTLKEEQASQTPENESDTAAMQDSPAPE